MKKYPEQFRIIRYYAEDKDKEYEYITNNFQLAAEEIAELYKQRRQIELLFKRLKQHLKIKQFF
jgi:IS4 transposase